MGDRIEQTITSPISITHVKEIQGGQGDMTISCDPIARPLFPLRSLAYNGDTQKSIHKNPIRDT